MQARGWGTTTPAWVVLLFFEEESHLQGNMVKEGIYNITTTAAFEKMRFCILHNIKFPLNIYSYFCILICVLFSNMVDAKEEVILLSSHH